MDDTRLSIIIPALNEEAALVKRQYDFQQLKLVGVEIILVDGGSDDRTAMLAETFADQIIKSPKGRAQQMNAGAGIARGDWLLFLHIDSSLPDSSLRKLLELQSNSYTWGRFSAQLSGRKIAFRIIEYLMNVRSSATQVCTGDQGIFVRKDLFDSIGGYPNQPLMEDIEISKTLKKTGGFIPLKEPILSSSRYWEKHGIMTTVLRMWSLRLRYFLGTPSEKLHALYYR